MSTKAQISALIAARTNAGGNTVAAERTLLSKFLDEAYPTPVVETNVTQVLTTKSGTDITYSFIFVKAGNLIHVRGTITNTTAGVLVNPYIANFNATEYQPKAGLPTYFIELGGTSAAALAMTDVYFGIVGNLPIGTFPFNFYMYVAKD